MKNESFHDWLNDFQQHALTLNERRLVVLVGDILWAKSLLLSAGVIAENQETSVRRLVYSDNAILKPTMNLQRFHDKLGSESDYVVFSHSKFSIDALAALSGTLVAGGILFLVIPSFTEFEESLFVKRFISLLQRKSEHVVIEQSAFQLPSQQKQNNPIIHNNAVVDKTLLQYDCVTHEQVNAVDAVIKVLKGKRKRPLVLTADRGRGKSSALALASSYLLNTAKKDNTLRLIVTAADQNSLQVYFRQLEKCLPSGEWRNNKFIHESGIVEFVPVEQLIQNDSKASMVLVDEAASIPVYQLEHLADKYSRIVFSTTVHGYEGAGRGFTVKFQQKLNELSPHWNSLHIKQPIRYREDDPLEELIFDACLLNAEFENITEDIDINTLAFKVISRQSLSQDENLLSQVVSVLVTAHYQTKPSDVKMLLDNPNINLLCLFSHRDEKSYVVAVAMLINEGCHLSDSQLNKSDIQDIQTSKRRMTNHFTPQSLLIHCGAEQAFDFHYMRVMRIAVHLKLQQQGIGRYFLSKITEFAKSQKADFLSTSFGATKSLLSFWLQDSFTMARLGFTKDSSSGEHSALLLKPLNEEASKLAFALQYEYYRSFDFLLSDEYQYLTTELIALILSYCPSQSEKLLSAKDKRNVIAFSKGHIQYSCCVFSLYLWLKEQIINNNLSSLKYRSVLIQRILQRHSIAEVSRKHNLSGKKELEQLIRSEIKIIHSD